MNTKSAILSTLVIQTYARGYQKKIHDFISEITHNIKKERKRESEKKLGVII